MMTALKIMLLVSAFPVLGSCNFHFFDHKVTMFIVDTSGSMRKDGLFQQVKNSIKAIAVEQQAGDLLYLVTFDARASLVHEMRFEAQENGKRDDLVKLFAVLDSIEAKGKWTNLLNAMEFTLKLAAKISGQEPINRIRFVLYTDGIHDPPPELKDSTEALNFDELFSKFFPDKQKDYPWFIYFVELDEVDPQFMQSLATRNELKIVEKKQMQAGANFLSEEDPNKQAKIWSLAILGFFLILLLLILKRVIGSAVVIPDRFLGKGGLDIIKVKKGNILATAKGIDLYTDEIRKNGPRRKQVGAKIRVDLLGRMMLEPREGMQVRIDGELVNGQKKLRYGDRIQIGSQVYKFGKGSSIKGL